MIKYLTILILGIPFISFAAENNIMDLLIKFVNLANNIVGFLIAIATLVFLWGVLLYVIHGDSESKKTEAKGYMTYGIVTLFVMVSVWGITYIIANSFGLQTGIELPDKKSSVDTHVVLLDNK